MILVFEGSRRISFRETSPRPGWVSFQSELIGISAGTELLIWRGDLPVNYHNPEDLAELDQPLAYPLAYGYMNVGRLEDGSRVFAYAPHGDRLWVRPEDTVPIGELAAEDAVFLASLETALHLHQAGRPTLGQRVAIWGLGIIGLGLAFLLGRWHRGPVVAFDPLSFRRERARELGVEAYPPEELSTALLRHTGGEGFELAFEVSGSLRALREAGQSLAPEGLVVVGSWYGGGPNPLEWWFHARRLRVNFAQVSVPLRELGPRWTTTRRRALALELLGELRPSRWITHRFRLHEADRAFELLEREPQSCLGVVLEP